jgi:hypothetical protein
VNALLPRRITKAPKRATRWRSQAHLTFVRKHECCRCGSTINIQAAHVRLGSGAGTGQKPDDWRAVSLCGGAWGSLGCHDYQHRMGEETFWKDRDVEALIEAFIKASPRRAEIERVRKEREQ